MKKILILIAMACTTMGAWAAVGDKVWSGTREGVDLRCVVLDDDNNVSVEQVIVRSNDATTVTIPGSFEYESNNYKITRIGHDAGGYLWYVKETGVTIERSNFTKLVIEEGVTLIKSYSFDHEWTGLTEIIFPTTLTEIESNAFQDCTSLTSIISKSDAITLGSDVFKFTTGDWDGIKNQCKVTVPEGRSSAYFTGDWSFWHVFTNKAEAAKIKITDVGYATYYTTAGSYTVPTGLEAKTVSGVSGSKLTFSDALTTVLKECAVLIKGDEGIYMAELNTSGDTYDGVSTNLLKGGTMDTSTDYYYYKLANYTGTGGNGLGWYWGAANGASFTNGEHKAYLQIIKAEAPNAPQFFPLLGGSTGISATVIPETEGEKVYYNLAGQRVENPTKGLYIVNGKKVIIK